MKNLTRILIFIIPILLSSCDRYYDSSPIIPPAGREPIKSRNEIPSGNLVWVGKLIVGGVQCDTIHYSPPNTKELLNNAGIPVVDTMTEYLSTCAACGCPDYAAIHFALIDKIYIRAAEKLGFIIRPLPWLYVYTDKKSYRDCEKVNFTIDNPTDQIAFVLACNYKLTYWLEIFRDNSWSEVIGINIGPCLDLFEPYITLLPNYSLKEQLNLCSIENLESGTYRIKIEYEYVNNPYNYNQYSNTFKVSK